MSGEHILKLNESFESDTSLRRYEFHEYLPVSGTNLNTPGEIRIHIESLNDIFHTADSLLIIEGRLLKTDNGTYAVQDNVALINNAPMYLFNNIRYELSANEIESINNPGQSTTMKGLLKYSDDFSHAQGINLCWMKDTADSAALLENEGQKARHSYILVLPTAANRGSFSFAIPLSHIFGFAEDYDRILTGMRHVLTLVRQGNDDAIYRNAAAHAGKVELSKIAWYMPRVLLNVRANAELLHKIEKKIEVDVGFRAHHCDIISVPEATTFNWRMSVKSGPECPRWIVIGFQTNKARNQEKNPAVFDHCNAKKVWVELNGHAYPEIQYRLCKK